ncbi:hypothetical protein PAHAL_2G356300 [Panicum hallii]|uniref:Uncharacterized protein n=1 Tax=Panicum hallii TaxID=206008 RepID=A0A2T8KRH2_9POAL|nr:hypothetical protein PAHAL_2G356300 [Panicum hallii]
MAGGQAPPRPQPHRPQDRKPRGSAGAERCHPVGELPFFFSPVSGAAGFSFPASGGGGRGRRWPPRRCHHGWQLLPCHVQLLLSCSAYQPIPSQGRRRWR